MCGAADFDSKLSVYCNGCDVLTCVDGDDDACPGFLSEVLVFGRQRRVFNPRARIWWGCWVLHPNSHRERRDVRAERELWASVQPQENTLRREASRKASGQLTT